MTHPTLPPLQFTSLFFGLDLMGFLDGSSSPPVESIARVNRSPSPALLLYLVVDPCSRGYSKFPVSLFFFSIVLCDNLELSVSIHSALSRYPSAFNFYRSKISVSYPTDTPSCGGILCGIVPGRIRKLKLLYELDVSNNRFVGAFPMVILDLPELKYLDLWFNDFKGEFPPTLFDKKLDVIFLNGNRFHSTIPENLGNFPASVIVLANNNIIGFIPKSIRNMAGKLDEFIASHNELSCCLPQEITLLNTKTVFDVSFNKFMGDLPRGMEYL
ncbi:hypothetical protein ACS0TY_018468 [Phlomoides rotata]